MLNGWGIRAKLLGGFALVLLLLLITVGFSLSGMRSISGELDEILDNRYVKVDTANDLIKNTSEMGRHIRSIIISKKPEEQKKWMDRIAELRQSNAQLLEKLDASVTSPEGRKLLADIAQVRTQLQGKYQPLFSLVNEGKNDEAGEYLKTEFVPVNNAFMDALEKFNAHEETAMLKAKKNAATTASHDRILEVAFSVLALLIGISVALILSSSVSQGVTQAVKLANRIATGDLRSDGEARIRADRDEVTQLLAALETMREQLSNALRQVQQHAVSVADSARELTSMSEQVADSTAQQADSTAAAAASIEELTVSVNQVADNAVNASDNARSAGEVAREGGQEIKHSAELMQAMGSAVETTSQQMTQLAQEVQKVGSVVTVIREVADQTNLLALNAAIEAARAGESGRGFAVVADEVRKLAERTTQSAGEITRTIEAIQGNASGVQQSMEDSRQQSVQAAQSTFRTSEHILDVEQGTGHVLNAIANIDLALKEQKHASLSLARNMEQISQMAEGNSAAVEELASTSNQLMSLSQSLQTVVSGFRL